MISGNATLSAIKIWEASERCPATSTNRKLKAVRMLRRKHKSGLILVIECYSHLQISHVRNKITYIRKISVPSLVSLVCQANNPSKFKKRVYIRLHYLNEDRQY